MDLQLVAHIASTEEGDTVAVKGLTGEAKGFILLQQGGQRITANRTELLEAIEKLKEFEDGQTTEQDS